LQPNVTASPRGEVESNGRRTTGPHERNSIRPSQLASLRVSGEAQIREMDADGKRSCAGSHMGDRELKEPVRRCGGGWRQNGRKSE